MIDDDETVTVKLFPVFIPSGRPFGLKTDFMKKVSPVYTHSMKTIYLSLNAQVGEGTFFRKSPVLKGVFLILQKNIFERT